MGELWLPCKLVSKFDSNMQAIGFQEALERVLVADPRYHADAYIFLRDALEATLKRRKKARKDASGHVARYRAARRIPAARFTGIRSDGHHGLRLLGCALH